MATNAMNEGLLQVILPHHLLQAALCRPHRQRSHPLDMLTNVSTPGFSTISIEPGAYSTIKMKIHKTEKDFSNGSDADYISGRSIYFAGTFQPASGTPQTFTLIHELDEEFEFSNKNSPDQKITISEGLNSILVAFALSRWFDFSNPKTSKDVDFSSISGEINLTPGSQSEAAKALREVIKENIKESADFAKDDDKNGEFDK